MQLKIFKKKKVFKKGGIHVNPNVYWDACLFIGFIIALVAAAYGFYMLQQAGKENQALGAPSPTTEAINKDKINEELDYFSQKAQKSAQIINSPSPLVDPSQ